jgi:uroporphyrinogen decarboxylase
VSIEHIPARMRAALEARNDGPPPFIPAVYEHKAWFTRRTPSEIARDADLLAAAVLEEFGQLAADAVTVGVDVYNVEAEAVGSRVSYPPDGSTGVPAIEPAGHALSLGGPLPRRLPNPLRDGRMPVMIKAARRVVREIGPHTWVRGAVSGPLSLAVNLVGMDALFLGLMTQPDDVRTLLRFAAGVAEEFAKAFIDEGAGVAIFDSLASPALLSPDHYRAFVAEPASDLVGRLRERGLEHVPLIIGGNTAPIAGDLAATGANNLLCDFGADWDAWREAVEPGRGAVRRNIEPSLLADGPEEAVHARMAAVVDEAEGYGGFIGGTAVVPYGTPLRNLLAARDACRRARLGGDA